MSEARHSERVRTMLGAQIVFNNKNSTIQCQIRNLSSTGARLVLSETLAMPQEFDLVVPQKGKTYRARLRWRTPEGAGIEFIQDDKRDMAPASRDLTERVRELEAENELLRKRVLALMQQLDKAGGSRAVA